MRKPPRLRPGDTIGAMSPASPTKQEAFEKGVQTIEARGYRVVRGTHVFETAAHCDYLAGKDEDRAADLMEMFTRSDVQAVFASRGGYGAVRTLPFLDWNALAAHPKVFTGYSDITTLHSAFNHNAGFVTIHGPNVESFAYQPPEVLDLFWRLVESAEPLGTLPADPTDLQTVVPGKVEGPLAGGCLTLLARACGTPYAPDFRGKIVLIEDTNEALYRVDRDLTQLLHAGLLDEAAGFLLGTITNWHRQEDDPLKNTLDALWQDIFLPLGKPTLAGFPFGHVRKALPLPLGVQASLDAGAKTLTIQEPATA